MFLPPAVNSMAWTPRCLSEVLSLGSWNRIVSVKATLPVCLFLWAYFLELCNSQVGFWGWIFQWDWSPRCQLFGCCFSSYSLWCCLVVVWDHYNSVEESWGLCCREWRNFALYLLLFSCTKSSAYSQTCCSIALWTVRWSNSGVPILRGRTRFSSMDTSTWQNYKGNRSQDPYTQSTDCEKRVFAAGSGKPRLSGP